MKLRDLERHMRDQGCRKIGEGGNHTKWRGPTGRPTSVPRHKEISPGLVRQICKQLEIAQEQLARRVARTRLIAHRSGGIAATYHI